MKEAVKFKRASSMAKIRNRFLANDDIGIAFTEMREEKKTKTNLHICNMVYDWMSNRRTANRIKKKIKKNQQKRMLFMPCDHDKFISIRIEMIKLRFVMGLYFGKSAYKSLNGESVRFCQNRHKLYIGYYIRTYSSCIFFFFFSAPGSKLYDIHLMYLSPFDQQRQQQQQSWK